MVVPRPFGDGATDLGDQISDREPTVGMGSTVAVVFDGDGLSRLTGPASPMAPSIDSRQRPSAWWSRTAPTARPLAIQAAFR